VKFGQKWCLNCLDLKTMRSGKCSRFCMGGHFLWILFRAIFQKFWAKILRTPQNMPATTPMFQLHALYRRNRHRLQAICK